MTRLRSIEPRGIERPRIAMLSLHTSPLAQPGSGDAGGMNVYVWEISRRLVAAGVDVEIFTRATGHAHGDTHDLVDGVLVRHLPAGPRNGLAKEELPAQLCAMTAGILRAESAKPAGWFDLVHSHYWLSGQVGWVSSERWGVPLVHSMHTLALAKNRDLRPGDTPEPRARIIGEQQVVNVADMLVSNTEAERWDLVSLYDADPARTAVVHPGVDLDEFTPGDRTAARRQLGLDPNVDLLVFVGRLQPLKAPDVLLAAAAQMDRRSRPLHVVICGGASGNGREEPERLAALAHNLGIAEHVTFLPPLPKGQLVALFRAATAVAVPSHSETFGLVAVEAQACGAPVVAADVGGLRTVVTHGKSGVLVAGHNPADWAAALEEVRTSPRLAQHLRAGSLRRASELSWDATVAGLIDTYREALHARRRQPLRAQA